jgi:hypothetical protein
MLSVNKSHVHHITKFFKMATIAVNPYLDRNFAPIREEITTDKLLVSFFNEPQRAQRTQRKKERK